MLESDNYVISKCELFLLVFFPDERTTAGSPSGLSTAGAGGVLLGGG